MSPREILKTEGGADSVAAATGTPGPQAGETELVGHRRVPGRLDLRGERSRRRLRYPFTRRTPLLAKVRHNPFTLRAEWRIADWRPVLWLIALLVLSTVPTFFGSNAVVSAATTFAIYAAINVIWMLQIGTAGIFSLASLATVGVSAYGTAVLSVYFGFPWWAVLLAGPLFGLAFGVIISIPAIRMEGFYYALLTVGISELCRAYASQSRILGASVGGLFGVDGFVPSSLSDKGGLILGYYAALFVLVLSLVLYRIVDGQRLGRLLRAAPEGHEAFAEALGIDYRRVRIQVFLVSSAALGGVGGFYASLQHGVSPSLFTMDQLLLMLGMIVIGGIGTTEGAVAGTLIVVFFDKVLIGFGPARLILIAGIMLLTVLFFRGGLFGSVSQFRAWRAKQKSERADTRTKGSEIMPEQATEIADKQKIYEQRFDVAIRRQLKALITDELIEEHRNSFRERRSENLNRLLTYFRRASVVDKYAVLTIKAFAEYRIVALSGKRGVPPRIVDDKIYPTEEDARHAVFLKRVQDLMEA